MLLLQVEGHRTRLQGGFMWKSQDHQWAEVIVSERFRDLFPSVGALTIGSRGMLLPLRRDVFISSPRMSYREEMKDRGQTARTEVSMILGACLTRVPQKETVCTVQ